MPMNTLIASQSGRTAISVPAGFTDEGLPVGLELMGAPFTDRDLIAIARVFESTSTVRRAPIVS